MSHHDKMHWEGDAWIASEIESAGGVVTFARFMELALYAPGHGFYEREKRGPGREGDFYTSVSVGPLFGELLAWRMASWLKPLLQAGQDGRWPVMIVEAGAHDGRLAADILQWFKLNQPAMLGLIRYAIIEPSENRRHWQQKRLQEFEGRVQWIESPAKLPQLRGVIFSNELLDAFPVHRLGWDAGRKEWFEWGVGWNEHAVWRRMEPALDLKSSLAWPRWPAEVLGVLPDGFSLEISPSAADWWAAVAGCLRQGRLMTMDYGFYWEELMRPERAGGTLRAYFHHAISSDILAYPGFQDLTAHVNFSVLQEVGEKAGLKTEGLVSQESFLMGIIAEIEAGCGGGEYWTSERRRQLQTLVHPVHLGRSFRVLIQRRDGG